MDRVWKSLWIKLVAANLWLVWSNFKSNPLWCVFGVKQFAQRHLWVLPAGIHRNHFHLINFSFSFWSHIQRRALDAPLRQRVSTQLLWQTFRHTLRTYSMFTIGGHSMFTFSKRLGHYGKWSPLAPSLWRKWPCLDNRLSEKETPSGKRWVGA